ncbi:LysR family transcriptional regulator [Ruegeria sp. HKCCD8929]|uniref:LysR family transcriptional regulator n=1 Tax=Ruegeria sp. HKCCD8929 TaxID=2683006 RepID=UPI00148A065B|nr:LysR family transcriptional regulator [Ruegeria sp. HKCCD8929]
MELEARRRYVGQMDRVKQIEAFLAVAQTRNFTRAADKMGMSQPALSSLVSKFEQELGIRLFDRTTRTVELTQAADDFLPDAERILLDIESSIESLRDSAALLKGHLRIAALPSLFSSFLPALLQDFRGEFPGLNVSLREAQAGELVELVAENKCDIGFGIAPDDVPNIRFRPLFEDHFVLVVGAGSPFAGRSTVPWAELADHSIIAMQLKTSVREAIERAAIANSLHLKIAFEVQYMASAVGLARAGHGATILPSTAIKDIGLEGISIAELTEPTLTRKIGFVQNAERLLAPAANRLVQYLDSHRVKYL